MLLFLISFIAGVLTAIAPCVLPLLPVIVGGSLAGGSKYRAYTISISLGVSVIVFTLLLKASTVFIDIPQSYWQWFSAAILILFGLVMVFPKLWDSLGFVNAMNMGGNKLLASGYQQNSFWGDALMGAALGPVFSSCSPTYFVILATVLPASFDAGFADLLAYAVGLSGFLLVIALVGQKLVDKLGVAIEPGGWFRRGIGILFIVVGVAVGTGAEAGLEAYLLNNGFDFTFIEQRLLGAPQSAPMPSGSQTHAAIASLGTPNATTSQPMLTAAEKASMYPKAPELAKIDGYINTPSNSSGQAQPITIGQFKGEKVVLVDFWTYSCINCQREIPYVNMWEQKYASQGLEIIGVSTPEFAFEHVLSNVQNAVKQFGIKYPVVLDNEYGTWNAFGNNYWPNVYLIDIDGYVVYQHAGEGEYDKTEMAIQRALAERAQRLGTSTPSFAAPQAPKGALEVDETQLGSPETYFGSNRNSYLGNGTPGKSGVQSLAEPQTVNPNTLYLIGTWDIEPEYAETPSGVGSGQIGSDRIDYFYKAKNVYFVAGSSGAPVQVEVLRDSAPVPQAVAGSDVYYKNGKSYITVSGQKLYNIVSDSAYSAHVLEFIISAPGLQAYTFTFG